MSNPAITVYTKPACVQCRATFSALDKAGIEYQSVDMTRDPDALDYVRTLGYMQAPVVQVTYDTTHIDHWSGFQPDRIKSITKEST